MVLAFSVKQRALAASRELEARDDEAEVAEGRREKSE